jgi:hypothetical protein
MDMKQKPAPNDQKFIPEGGKDMKAPTPAPKSDTLPGSEGNSKKPYKLGK